jgi:hypothetical protein
MKVLLASLWLFSPLLGMTVLFAICDACPRLMDRFDGFMSRLEERVFE